MLIIFCWKSFFFLKFKVERAVWTISALCNILDDPKRRYTWELSTASKHENVQTTSHNLCNNRATKLFSHRLWYDDMTQRDTTRQKCHTALHTTGDSFYIFQWCINILIFDSRPCDLTQWQFYLMITHKKNCLATNNKFKLNYFQLSFIASPCIVSHLVWESLRKDITSTFLFYHIAVH